MAGYYIRVDLHSHRIDVLIRFPAYILEIVRFGCIRVVSKEVLTPPQNKLGLRILRVILQHERPASVDQTYREASHFFVIWNFRMICLVGHSYRRTIRHLHREHQILVVRQFCLGVCRLLIRAYDSHAMPPVDLHGRRGGVARIVRRNDGIFRSRVIVAAVGCGKRIIGGVGLLLHTVDGHGLDAGGRFTALRRIAHGEGVRARSSNDDILNGVALAVRQNLQHRRRRVLFQQMIAHGTVLLLNAPVAGDVLSVLFGHLRRRVARLTILIPARPDVA